MSYKKLRIWQAARKAAIEIHKMTVDELPKLEMFEEAQQIRKSSKSTRSNIVEGYGRRRYKAEFIRFLVYSLASNDETVDHLESLFDTESLKNKALFSNLHKQLEELGKSLNHFIRAVENQHNDGNSAPK